MRGGKDDVLLRRRRQPRPARRPPSRPESLQSPKPASCEADELFFLGDDSACCTTCGGHLGGTILETLREIVALSDTLGEHACDCGHPEVRCLSDGVFHRPACGFEVILAQGGSTHTGHTPR